MLITYVAFPLIVSLKATLGLPDITGQLNSVRILCGKKNINRVFLWIIVRNSKFGVTLSLR